MVDAALGGRIAQPGLVAAVLGLSSGEVGHPRPCPTGREGPFTLLGMYALRLQQCKQTFTLAYEIGPFDPESMHGKHIISFV